MSEQTIYDIGYDLVIKDAEVKQMSAVIAQRLELYENNLKQLVETMNQVREDAIIKGNMAENLELLNQQLQILVGETGSIKQQVTEYMTNYLVEIDEADGDLYGAFGCGKNEYLTMEENPVRDYRRETLLALDQQIEEIQTEICAQGIEWYLWQGEYPEVDFGDYPASMQRSQEEMSYELFQLPYRWNDELYKVHQIEEKYAARLLEINDTLKLYRQSVCSVVEMLSVEKITMDHSTYWAESIAIHEPYFQKILYVEQNLTQAQLENLLALGYDYQTLVKLYRNFNEQDIQFFGYLAEGTQESYQKAFAINPNTLSDAMNVAMADYAMHLVMANQEDCTQLEKFNNAILSAAYYFHEQEIGITDSSLCYSDIYLQRIYIGTEQILTASTVALATTDYGTEKYRILYEKHFSGLSMLCLWSSEMVVLEEISREEGIPYTHTAQVGGMTYDGNGSFDFRVYHAVEGFAVYEDEGKGVLHEQRDIPYDELAGEERVTTNLCMTSDNLSLHISSDRIRDAREAYEATRRSGAEGMLAGAVLDLFAAVLPGCGGMTGIVNYGMTFGELIGDYETAESNLLNTIEEETARYFYIGGTCTINTQEQVCFYGMYDPEKYRKILALEQEGLAAAMGWGNNEIGIAEGYIDSILKGNNTDYEKAELARKLLDGGFSFDTMSYVDSYGKQVEVKIEIFLDVLKAIKAEEFMK